MQNDNAPVLSDFCSEGEEVAEGVYVAEEEVGQPQVHVLGAVEVDRHELGFQ